MFLACLFTINGLLFTLIDPEWAGLYGRYLHWEVCVWRPATCCFSAGRDGPAAPGYGFLGSRRGGCRSGCSLGWTLACRSWTGARPDWKHGAECTGNVGQSGARMTTITANFRTRAGEKKSDVRKKWNMARTCRLNDGKEKSSVAWRRLLFTAFLKERSVTLRGSSERSSSPARRVYEWRK